MLLIFQCYWKNAKSKIKRMNGVDSNQLTSYLKEYMVLSIHNVRPVRLSVIPLRLISLPHWVI